MTSDIERARELLPCPFCGGEARWLSKQPGGRDGEFEARLRAVGCGNPRCDVQPHTKWQSPEKFVSGKGYVPVPIDDDIVAAWNRRTPDSQALTEAEKRGAEREREACALIAETDTRSAIARAEGYRPIWFKHAQHIAAAIRARS